MELPLVVGTDGSDSSLAAVDRAADEAACHGLELRIVHASLWEQYEGLTPSFSVARSAEEVLAEHIAASAAERARKRRPDVSVTTAVLAEDPVQALLAESDHAHAVVVGQRGRGDVAALLLGSVSLSVAARARCPVLVVRGEHRREGGHGWVLLGMGEQGQSDQAVEFAFQEAEAHGWGVEAIHGWRWPHQRLAGPGGRDDSAKAAWRHAEDVLDAALRRPMADHPQVEVRRAAVEGPVRRTLLDASTAADLLVVGARRRGTAFGWQIGPVNHAVLLHAACPVAVVPQRGEAPAAAQD